MGSSAFGWGWLSDRWGVRPVILAGAVLLGIGLVATSYAADLLQFQLLFGILIGIAGGSLLRAADDRRPRRGSTGIAISRWR